MPRKAEEFPLLSLSIIQDDRWSFGKKPKDLFEDGCVFLVDKPAGWTSFDVVHKLRNATHVRRIGHCGTLDPFATGLLVVCSGRATRCAQELSNLEKEYVGAFQLGTQTDTDDVEGHVIAQKPLPDITHEGIARICLSFVGEIEQTPPAYSAVKVNGVRAYKKARAGLQPDLKPRTVTVHRFEVMDYRHGIVDFRIVCSKGTYIRSIARDLGNQLGSGALVRSLRRTRVGLYRVEDAVEPVTVSVWLQRF